MLLTRRSFRRMTDLRNRAFRRGCVSAGSKETATNRKEPFMKRKWIAAAAAAIFSATAFAQMGPGMMGGYGSGGGYGMGQGMMGGMGPGMMGGMGPGMMGGYGMGPGMMGGVGPGMMGGYGGLGRLNLNDEQRAKIGEIQQDVARKQWELMGKMHEQGFHMQQFGPGVDENAARKAYQAMADAHKGMFELSLDSRKRIESVLTKDQLEQLRRGWRGG